jgi:hypothetical protein
MVRSLEEVWIVRGVYLFQSRERTSDWGCATMEWVAMVRIERERGTSWLTEVPEFER